MARKGNIVCVAGAGSQLGAFLLPRLRNAGFRVLALSRKAPLRPVEVAAGVTWMKTGILANGERGDQVMRQPAPDSLISCAPLELAVRLVLRHPGLQRVIAFSSSSVLSKAGSPDTRERRQMAAMAEDEQALQAACAELGIALLLLRPTLIYGCGVDRNVSLLADTARRFGMIPLAGLASGLRQPVHADDLALLAVLALQTDQPLNTVSAACGGSTLTYREMAGRVAALQQRPVRLLTLPERLLASLVKMRSLLPGGRGFNAEMVRRQNRDLAFDDSALRLALNWSPRPFEPRAEDFQVPDYAKALQLPPNK